MEVVNFSLSTGIGTQVVNLANAGDTPAFVVFIQSGGTVDDTIAANCAMSFGFSDGTNDACIGFVHQDATSPQSTERWCYDTAVIADIEHGGSVQHLFSVSSFNVGSVTLSIDNQASVARLCTMVVLNTTEVSDAFVGFFNAGTGTGDQVFNTVGFELDGMFVGTHSEALGTLPSQAEHLLTSIGFVKNTGVSTLTNLMASISVKNAEVNAIVNGMLRNDAAVGQLWDGASTWRGVFKDADADGFTYTASASSGSSPIIYGAFKLNAGYELSAFDLSIPTSGDYNETTPGHNTDLGMIFSTVGVTTRNIDTTQRGGLAISAFDDSVVATVNAITQDSVVSSSTAKAMHSNQFRILDDSDQGDEAIGSSVTLDALGWDIALSTNPVTNPVLGFGIAIGATGAALPILSNPTQPVYTP